MRNPLITKQISAPSLLVVASLLGACADALPPEDPAAAPITEARLRVDWPPPDALIYTPGPVRITGEALGLRAVQARLGQGPWHPLRPQPGWALELDVPYGVHRLEIEGTDRAGERHQIRLRFGRGWRVVLPPPEAVDRAVSHSFDAAALRTAWAAAAPAPPADLPPLDLGWLIDQGLAAAAADPTHPLQHLRPTPRDTALRLSPLVPHLDRGEALGLPAARILAELFDVPADAPITDLRGLGEALLAAHPAGPGCCTVEGPALLAGLAPWIRSLGPTGDHPGLLTAVDARLLGPELALTAHARLSAHLAYGLDTAGRPTRALASPLDLRFSPADPQALQITGLAPRPRVALSLRLPVGVGVGGPGALDALPRGDNPAWRLPPWRAERQLLELSYRELRSRFLAPRDLHYAVGALDPALALRWDGGRIDALASPALDLPPGATWAWDLALEAAETALESAGYGLGAPLDLPLPPIDWPGGPEDLEARLRAALATTPEPLTAALTAPLGLPRTPPLLWFDGALLHFALEAGAHRPGGLIPGPLRALPVEPGPPTRIITAGQPEPALLEITALPEGVEIGYTPEATRW